MSKMFTGKDRLEMFAYDILHLISTGAKEDIEGIIKEFENSNVVRYIMNKYADHMYVIHEECPYDIDDWEEIFSEYSYLEKHHDVRRKMGLVNDDDGLLMILSIILEVITQK